MLRWLRSTAWLGLVLGWSQLAPAFEARFQIDPAQDLAALSETGRVAISVDRRDHMYTLDASAVLRVDPQRLLDVSIDYDRYAEMGIPNLQESHVVSATPGRDVVYTWNSMRCLGQSSKHYLAVQIAKGLTPSGAAGIQWQQVHRQPAWPYEEASAFSRLGGSWYLEPLAEVTVYVRYFMAAVLDPSIPEGMISWLIKRQLSEGTRALIHTLAREAALRPPGVPTAGPMAHTAGPGGAPWPAL